MKIPIDSAATVSGSRYPSPYHALCLARVRKRLGDALVLEVGSRRDDDEAPRSGDGQVARR